MTRQKVASTGKFLLASTPSAARRGYARRRLLLGHAATAMALDAACVVQGLPRPIDTAEGAMLRLAVPRVEAEVFTQITPINFIDGLSRDVDHCQFDERGVSDAPFDGGVFDRHRHWIRLRLRLKPKARAFARERGAQSCPEEVGPAGRWSARRIASAWLHAVLDRLLRT